MRLFTVETEERRRRTWRVAAPDAAQAMRAVQSQMPDGARIMGAAQPCDHGHDASSGQEALGLLLGQEYLPDGNAPMLVEDWVLRAHAAGQDATARDRANAILAPVGLRVYGATLWVGSAASLPTLGLIFAGTQWAGQGLTAALRRIEGAQLSNLTFAGKRARAVGLPLSSLFPMRTQPEAAQCMPFTSLRN